MPLLPCLPRTTSLIPEPMVEMLSSRGLCRCTVQGSLPVGSRRACVQAEQELTVKLEGVQRLELP